MSLDAGDQARLRRIEAQLTASDPALAGRFRRWTPSVAREPLEVGWSAVPTWMWIVFLVGFGTWMVAPAVGAAVAVGGACWAARRWARSREARANRKA